MASAPNVKDVSRGKIRVRDKVSSEPGDHEGAREPELHAASCVERPCAIKVTPRSGYRNSPSPPTRPTVTCRTRTGTKALLLVPTNMGVFQEVHNPCEDADVTAIELVVSSATLRE
jgi:hypothetical protein